MKTVDKDGVWWRPTWSSLRVGSVLQTSTRVHQEWRHSWDGRFDVEYFRHLGTLVPQFVFFL